MPRRDYNFVQYHQVILESDPIAYWIQDEKQGAMSYDWVRRRQSSDQDGAYTGVTLGEPGIGDGRTAPFFDGVNDFDNVFTLTFQGRFNGNEGTVEAWARVANAGVWTDGARRDVFILRVNVNNFVEARKDLANNTFRFNYRAGGVLNFVSVAPFSDITWFLVGITWSALADEVRCFLNGVQRGATQVGLGVWAGLLGVGTTIIGATNIVPGDPWHGYIEHGAVWDRPLPPNEINAHYRAAAYVPR